MVPIRTLICSLSLESFHPNLPDYPIQEPTDRRFIQSVGAIIIGSLLRERARDSDRAKLAFISQVSHEL